MATNINNMTKQELLNKVGGKKGFHSVIKDELAQDHIAGDPIEKRYLYVNHVNEDGTMGKKFVFYLLDTENDVASFYNVEEELDRFEMPEDVKALKALENYLGQKYQGYFLIRYDLAQRIAEADVFVLKTGVLTKKTVLVFKKGTNPINDIDIITA